MVQVFHDTAVLPHRAEWRMRSIGGAVERGAQDATAGVVDDEAPESDAALATDLLVEEVSIDGLCGVY
jgi:mycofactocin precursor